MSETATPTVEETTPKTKTAGPAPSIKIESSLFTIPQEELTIAFQRAIGMANGKIVSIDEKGKGIIEVDGFRYEVEDGRSPKYKKWLKLTPGLEIKFSFWPTLSKRGLQFREPGDPPRLKLSSIRKEVQEHGAVEVIGQVHKVMKDSFLMRLFSKDKKKDYFVTLEGKYKDQPGDYIQVIGKLEAGEIRYISHSVLCRKDWKEQSLNG